MTTQPMTMRIGELSRRVGVSTHVLRAWESRYELLRPVRSTGGYRLYGPGDERRVLAVLTLRDNGIAAAEACRTVLRTERLRAGAEGAGDNGSSGDSQVRMTRNEVGEALAELHLCIDDFDEAGSQIVLDRLSDGLNFEDLVRHALMPFLVSIGEAWERGELTIAHEHFATQIIRHRLSALALTWATGNGPNAILACPPGERHDVALLCLGVLLGNTGWQIRFLGADTPLPDLAKACRTVEPDLVILSATHEAAFEAVTMPLRELAKRHRLAIGGPGATAAVARAARAELLASDIVATTAELNATFRTSLVAAET
ncbi:MAG: cobalamin B12-binding domain-containing protein [Tetrasphaera sp.]|nr:cobalamin B12-binding domain-containing protein [Tetrasphaera sp.]